MSEIVTTCRIVLACAFAFAALAKLANRTKSIEAAVDLGIPAKLSPFVSTFVPLLESLSAIGLLFVSTAWLSALCQVMLLAAFSILISWNLLVDRHPKCHCFGEAFSRPIDGWSIGMNAGLIALGLVVVGSGRDQPGNSIGRWFDSLRTIDVVLLLSVTVLAFIGAVSALLTIHATSQLGFLMGRLKSLEEGNSGGSDNALVGEFAPDFLLENLRTGTSVTLTQLRQSPGPVLLVFLSPSCASCTELLPDLRRWEIDLSSTMTLAVIVTGSSRATEERFGSAGVSYLLVDPIGVASTAYRLKGTPSIVVIERGGKVSDSLTSGAQGIRFLVNRLGQRDSAVEALAFVESIEGAQTVG